MGVDLFGAFHIYRSLLKHINANIFTIVNNGRKLHKVWVGEFQTYEEAKRFTGEIRNKFSLESIVVSR